MTPREEEIPSVTGGAGPERSGNVAGIADPVRPSLSDLSHAPGECKEPDGGSVVPPVGRELAEVLHFLAGEVSLSSRSRPELTPDAGAPELDLADVRGQETAKRALEIAAAGGHNLLMLGPPGGGKTLLARRLPALLPDLPFEHALEVTRIHSVAGLLAGRALVRRAPFRAPHHSASDVGITGGGRPFRPGEMSLAHRGVLLLDELAEFRRPTAIVISISCPNASVSVATVSSINSVRS